MNALRQMREAKGISQRALARKADVAYKTIQLIEGGRHNPRLGTLRKIAKILGVDEESLVREAVRGHRAATIRECSLRIVRDGESSWILHLMEFVDDFRRSPAVGLVEDVPVPAVGCRHLALLAATVQALCNESGLKEPWWCAAVPRLRAKWFVSPEKSLRTIALAESPRQYRNKNIFVLENFLFRA